MRRLWGELFMRKIELVSWKNILNRVENIKKSFEIIYDTNLSFESKKIPLNNLYPTEDFLEKDKLALVLKKVILENYFVPIIAVKHEREYFILDGHHRSYLSKKLQHETIASYVILFPKGKKYKTRTKKVLEDIPIKEVSFIDDFTLKAFAQLLSILKYYEALYKTSFNLERIDVLLKDLVPTQPQARRERINSIKKMLVPIVCIEHKNKFYILDGHARSINAKEKNQKYIDAFILRPKTKVNFGIVKTAREMNLKNLEDITIVESRSAL
jgi:IMP dehydrogenase